MVILCIGLGETSNPFRFSSQLLQLPPSELRTSINGLDFVTHQLFVANHLHFNVTSSIIHVSLKHMRDTSEIGTLSCLRVLGPLPSSPIIRISSECFES